jgi:hypothetical protein
MILYNNAFEHQFSEMFINHKTFLKSFVNKPPGIPIEQHVLDPNAGQQLS